MFLTLTDCPIKAPDSESRFTGERSVLKVDSSYFQLILGIIIGGDLNSLQSLYLSHVFLSQEVLYLYSLVAESIEGLLFVWEGLDWEMGICESHFVFVALGKGERNLDDTSEHVLDLGFDGGDDTFVLLATQPFIDEDLDAFSLDNLLLEVNWDVLERLLKSSKRSCDFHDFALDVDGD